MEVKLAENTEQQSRKRRSCLRCGTTFDSEWAGERVCSRCKGSHGWRSGGISSRGSY